MGYYIIRDIMFRDDSPLNFAFQRLPQSAVHSVLKFSALTLLAVYRNPAFGVLTEESIIRAAVTPSPGRGSEAEVAVVNDSPVDCQSRRTITARLVNGGARRRRSADSR